MSELDNRQSKLELGMQYTPLRVYLSKLVKHYESSEVPMPEGYRRRAEEVKLAYEP
jgi:hypothetical protein